jgi:hypothetical protein
MNQITLRDIPSDVEHFIRDIAQKKNQSINKTILEFLRKGLGLPDQGKKRRDLSTLAGTWNEQDLTEFNENTKFFEDLDDEMWTK